VANGQLTTQKVHYLIASGFIPEQEPTKSLKLSIALIDLGFASFGDSDQNLSGSFLSDDMPVMATPHRMV